MTVFDLLKIDPSEAATEAAKLSASLRASGGASDLLSVGLAVVARRLERAPRRYLDYGPYWWALRALLVSAAHLEAGADDSIIRAEYTGGTPLETLVMAEIFRDDALASGPVGNREFRLSSDSPQNYTLFDSDMETSAARA
jgi:hypothetical protein